MSKKKIVLIDDDAVFLMLSKKLLGKEPYLEPIDTFTTVPDAFGYFQQLKESGSRFPDAVFVDLDMPQTDGLELARQLRETYLPESPPMGQPATKLYILSSSISQRDRQTAENMPAVSDYMEKPLSAAMLRQVLGVEEEQQPRDRERLSNPGSQQQDQQSRQKEI